MKEELKAGRDTLRKLWDSGLSGSALLSRHSEVVDSCLARLFTTVAGPDDGVALVATGGYGRGELYPFSDIDLLFLHEGRIQQGLLEKLVGAILYPLWDSGLEVGHSVRTVKECIADCKKDFHLQTSLLDSRLVAGSQKAMDRLSESYRKKFIEGRRKEFFEKITASTQERHKKYGGHSFQLEPDIKEGRGGFRDIQTMRWTAKVLFGFTNIRDMEISGLISTDERSRLEESSEALVRIRNRLHYLSGRKNDQLYYEHQESIAHALGYKDSPGQFAVESFMQQLYRNLQSIKVSTDLFFEYTSEKISRNKPSVKDRSIDEDLEIFNGRIRLADPSRIPEKPALLMSLFSRAAESGLPIHYRTRQAIADNLLLIDDRFRNSRQNARYFLNALKINVNKEDLLTLLLETGLLVRYIPEFGKIESLAQHDIYHTNTVDRHLLQTVSETTALSQEYPEIFTDITSHNVLYLAALLHDIGKGSGKEHSAEGAEIARGVGFRLGLAEQEVDDLDFLIRNHLFMAHTAQRRDLEDETLISRFAEHIGNSNMLNMLYLLSIADAKATGPASWSEWKGTLLQELFLKTAIFFDHKGKAKPDLSSAVQWMRDKVRSLIDPSEVQNVDALPDEYLTSFTPEEIKIHLKMREQLKDHKIVSAPADRGSYWSILVVSTDKTGLLAKICGTLTLNNLRVLAAKINTWPDGTVVDQIDVRPDFNTSFIEQDWNKLNTDLAKAVDNRLGLSHRLADRLNPLHGARKGAKRSRHQAKVVTDNKTSDQYTIIEIHADDQPALLYNITRTLADFELNISRAMISTRLEQLVDVFYLQTPDKKKIENSETLDEIKKALLYTVSP
ncbi:MAG: [protein-PII] uridylyltransferase [Proteobacteria bacterium]|nr:[protein-PII] uridylyltransferase [Pseudomonadota bacterium]MBU1737638.1 [protein-PII] uridylyltransferase [Pseudomonadota bacterium]